MKVEIADIKTAYPALELKRKSFHFAIFKGKTAECEKAVKELKAKELECFSVPLTQTTDSLLSVKIV